MISVFIENNPLFHNKVKWFFELIIKKHGAQVELVDHFDNKTLNNLLRCVLFDLIAGCKLLNVFI